MIHQMPNLTFGRKVLSKICMVYDRNFCNLIIIRRYEQKVLYQRILKDIFIGEKSLIFVFPPHFFGITCELID